MKPVICTIIAKNYLAGARVLCESFLQFHPDGTCYVLFIDSFETLIDVSKERFTAIGLDEITYPKEPSYRFKYNLTELATAAKPFLLRELLRRHPGGKVLYLDPDILITESLSGLFAQLDHCSVLLTPHLDADFPEDGLYPDECHILTSGQFNLGFLGVKDSAQALQLVSWLENKLMDRCVINHKAGYFVDQRFFDMSVGIFPWIGFEREPGYNVAYWNLHSRRIERNGPGWSCNGKTLYFFHFSAYSPARPGEISTHQNRFTLESRPDIAPLFDFYLKKLLAAGWESSKRLPYDYSVFSSGFQIHPLARVLYRKSSWFIRFDPDPFRSFGLLAVSFVFWLFPPVIIEYLRTAKRWIVRVMKR